MTVSTTSIRSLIYTSGSSFPFDFPVLDGDHVEVYIYPEDRPDQRYAVAGVASLNSDQSASPGGTVTYNLPSGYHLVVERATPYTQPTDLENQSRYAPEDVEQAHDRSTLQIQQIADAVERSIRVPGGVGSIPPIVYSAAPPMEGSYLRLSATGVEAAGVPAVLADEIGTVVDTHAALVGVEGSEDGQLALRLGFYAAGDGGGALFRWSPSATAATCCSVQPSATSGAGRWILQVFGPVDIRVSGMDTVVANCAGNVAALRELCAFMSDAGGGEIGVPAVGAPFTVNQCVPPHMLDNMTFRGGGEIRHVDPGNALMWSPAEILCLGSYGSRTGQGFIYDEPAYDIADASAGAQDVTLDTAGDAVNISVGDLVCIHDGSFFVRGVGVGLTSPRYMYPQTREITGVSGSVISFDEPLSADVSNDPVLRVLNTGTPSLDPQQVVSGLTIAYLTRNARIECNLSHSEQFSDLTGAALSGDAWGLFNNNLGYKCTLRGRFVSGNGISANMQCFSRVDCDLVTGGSKAWDSGMASEQADITIRLERREMDVFSPLLDNSALIWANEGSHHCRVNISTMGPLHDITGSHIIAGVCNHMEFNLDLDLPDWNPDFGGLFYGNTEDNGNSTDTDIHPSDIKITGNVRVQNMTYWLFAGQCLNSGGTAIKNNETWNIELHDLTLRADTCENAGVDWSEYAFYTFDCNDLTIRNLDVNIGDFKFIRPRNVNIRDSYMPNSIITQHDATSYTGDRWFDNCVMADRWLPPAFYRDGQRIQVQDEAISFWGGIQSVGPIYSYRSGLSNLADGATGEIRTGALLGEYTRWRVEAMDWGGNIMGSALVTVGGSDYVVVVAMHETGCTFGDDSHSAITITNDSGGTRDVQWTLLEL